MRSQEGGRSELERKISYSKNTLQVSDDDLAKARSMVPQALEPYVEQLAKHGPGSYSMPKVVNTDIKMF